MSRERPFLSHFSPQWTKPEYLEAILVQRGDLLSDSVAALRNSVLAGAPHHLLFIGPRGAGKTHLITLIQHRLSSDPELRDRMRVAWLNEDETATSFFRLLIAIYRSLSDRYPEEFPSTTLQALAGKDPGAAQEQLTRDLLHQREGRSVVCILENLDSLFRSLSVAEQRNWRAFLQNHPVMVTVGTAQALFDGIADHDEPFFGFFDTRHLKPLNVEEARQLLERIATLHGREDVAEFLRTPTGRARVDAIRALAGGNPRLYLIFSDLLVNAQALDDLVRPFEEMVDRQLTSYYQERLRWLSPQQREIVQLLCRSRGPVAVKHIAEGLFTTHNSITGQLKQLRELRYVDSHPIGREVYYELAEPLMRLALQVKETHDRRPLALIVDFLRIWHEESELTAHLAACPPGSPARAYLESAHRLLRTEPSLRLELFRRDLEVLAPEQCDDTTLAKARSVAEQSRLAADWIRLGTIRLARREWSEAIPVFTSVIENQTATPEEVCKALHRRGYAYGHLGRVAEEIADYTRAIELPGAPPSDVALALNNRGFTYKQEGKIFEAIADYTRAIELPGASPEEIVWVLNNRGNALSEAGRTMEAIEDYTRCVDLPAAPPQQVAYALLNRGAALREVGMIPEAIANYTRAIELPGVSLDLISEALNHRALVHGQACLIPEAIADFTRILNMSGAPVDQVGFALYNRGVMHGEIGKTLESIDDYTRVIELPGAPPNLVARALNNRGCMHWEGGRTIESIEDYSRAIDLPCSPPDQVVKALKHRGFTYKRAGRFAEAIADFTRASEVPGAPYEDVLNTLFSLCILRSQSGEYHATFEDLRRLFTTLDNRSIRELLEDGLRPIAWVFVQATFAVTTEASRWTALLVEFAGHFARFGSVAQLGEVVVMHLPTLAASPLNHSAWDAWAKAWEDARAALPEAQRDALDIPLRLLRAGIAWLKTRHDTELLSLPREERRILREALRLPAETQEKSW